MALFQLGIALGQVKDITGATETIKEVRPFPSSTVLHSWRWRRLGAHDSALGDIVLTSDASAGFPNLCFNTKGTGRSDVPLRAGRSPHSA